jgi:hypothetical protein
MEICYQMFNFFLTLFTLFPMAVYEQGDGSPDVTQISLAEEYPQGTCSIKLSTFTALKKVEVQEVGCDFFALTEAQREVFSGEVSRFNSVKSVTMDLGHNRESGDMLAIIIEGWVGAEGDASQSETELSNLWAGFREDGISLVFWKDVTSEFSNFSGKEFDKDGRQSGIWSREEH